MIVQQIFIENLPETLIPSFKNFTVFECFKRFDPDSRCNIYSKKEPKNIFTINFSQVENFISLKKDNFYRIQFINVRNFMSSQYLFCASTKTNINQCITARENVFLGYFKSLKTSKVLDKRPNSLLYHYQELFFLNIFTVI